MILSKEQIVRIPRAQVAQHLTFDHLRWQRFFEFDCFKADNFVYGIYQRGKGGYSHTELGEEMLKQTVVELHAASSRLERIAARHVQREIPLEITAGECFGITGERIGIGVETIKELVERDTREVTVAFRARFFHELIHSYTQRRDEILTLFGQFLYDPLGNIRFNGIACHLEEQINGNAVSYHGTPYLVGWLVAARMLVEEARNFAPEEEICKDGHITPNLIRIFAHVPEDERDAIMRRRIEEDEIQD